MDGEQTTIAELSDTLPNPTPIPAETTSRDEPIIRP